MADVMEDRPELAPDRERLYCLIEETPYLEWLLLTKRPQNFRRFLPEEWLQHPRPNVCGMTTVESAACLWRADDLLKTPFATRGLSMEPLLGAVDIQYHVWGQSFDVTDPDYDAPDGSMVGRFQRVGMTWEPVLPAIDWVIVGGESGSGARPTHPEWVRQIRDICVRSRVPFLFKQWGDWAPGECVADSRKHPSCVLFDERWVECSDDWVDEADLGPIMYRVGKKAAGRLLDGRQWCEFPIPVTVTPHGRGPAAKRGGRA
jgi:protein gp37